MYVCTLPGKKQGPCTSVHYPGKKWDRVRLYITLVKNGVVYVRTLPGKKQGSCTSVHYPGKKWGRVRPYIA